MFTNHSENFWNDRYENQAFAYGTEPNAFLLEQKDRFRTGTRALAVGDGEGRNGVWLAQQGLSVLSVDLSATGLQKAQQLAQDRGVALETQAVDLSAWDWPVAAFDVVVSIYVHFAPDVRKGIHQAMIRALKPDGLLIIEAFTPEQLVYQAKCQSGGPPKEDMLYPPDTLRRDFAEANELELYEAIVELREGEYHTGPAAVVRGVFRR